MNELIDQKTLKFNPGVDIRLLEDLRKQAAELARLFGPQGPRSYELVPPFENPAEHRQRRDLVFQNPSLGT